VKEPSALGDMAPLLVQSRFRVTEDRDEWFTQMRAALAVLGESTGFHRGWIGQATDDAELVTLTTQWEGVGAYRKALSRFEVKAEVIPLLSTAIDEPTAYEAVVVEEAGEVTSFASGLAADHDAVGLGSASAAFVPPVTGADVHDGR
jgi:hypothetical protein